MLKKLFLYSSTTLMLLTAYIANSAEKLTLEQKAAKMIIIGVAGTTLENSGSTIVDDVKNKGVSGVIFFEKNITPVEKGLESKAILTKFIADLKALTPSKLIVSIDQEGGLVNRLKSKYGFKEMVSHQTVGENGSDTFARETAAIIASEVASVGFNVNFAPCVDVNVNPSCPVIGKVERSFSSDENRVATLSKIYVEEHHKNGLLTSLKHFPGHGSSLVDSHHGFTDLTETWSERELLPYKELIAAGYNDMVMVSHLYNSNFDDKYPATLSKKTITGILRGKLGFKGVVVTDDMQMKAIVDNYGFEESVVLGVNAGIDLFIISGNIKNESFDIAQRFIDTVVEGVKSGEIEMETVDAAIERIELLVNRIK